jgi:hypothetical protein
VQAYATRSISQSDRSQKELALALIDKTGDGVVMTASSALSRLARRARSSGARPPHVSSGAVISIRIAGQREEAAIARLAQLSEHPVPSGRALVAEVDGQVRAALPLARGPMLVDPFHPSTEVRELLSLRAAQLGETG